MTLTDLTTPQLRGLRHTPHGYWLEEAGPVSPLPALAEGVNAQVVIIGGGYAGMWTAWHLLEHLPATDIVLLEAERCGLGPSGRNGGFCETLWGSLHTLRARLGDADALRLATMSSNAVAAIGDWCTHNDVDAWFAANGTITASAAPAQDKAFAGPLRAAQELGATERVRVLTRDELRHRCASPVFRAGVLIPDEASVQPARLALGLRRVLIDRGVRVFENTRVDRLATDAEGVSAHSPGGTVRAPHGVLTINAATRGVAPLRSRLAVTSSHLLITEPVPDVLADLGWTGGENITDGRTFVHYFRTTSDGRIAFGWGGGKIAWGARLGGRTELDRDVVVETHRHLLRVFPQLHDRAITHAWGGPIDVSPSHLPQVGTLDGTALHYAFGFTGNGVGPSHLVGQMLSDLACEQAGDRASLLAPDRVRVPPEPLAWAGGSVVRLANLRRERLQELEREPSLLVRAVAGAPRALGIHLGR